MSIGGAIQGAQAPCPAPESTPAPRLAMEPFAPVDLEQMEGFRRELTLRFVALLQDPGFRNLVTSRLAPGVERIGLNQLVTDWAETWPSPEHRRAAALFAALDRDLRDKMGLAGHARTLLGLDLIWPREQPRRLDWSQALFAVRPQSAPQGPAAIEAYDIHGRMVRLDPATRPAVPVIMLGADRRESARAGLQVVNQGLERAGCSSRPLAADPAAPIPCAKLASIRIDANLEPWWKDGLEVYALVSGIDPAEPKANVQMVNLPYLEHGGTDYFPNQVLLVWTNFRFGAANIQFWDHGDSTNYQALLEAILKGVSAALAVGGAPAFAWIPALADGIVAAMPSRWWTVPETLLDTFYTLEQGPAYQDLDGMAKGVRINLVPWMLSPKAEP